MIVSNNIDIAKNDPYVFIVENIDSPIIQSQIDTPIEVSKSTDNRSYEYIATVAKFGITNDNGREYQREDYLSQIPSLKNKIQRGSLMGELDHPQNYDISIKNVSHYITDIWYDSEDDTVKIKLKIVDTPYGKIAKILIDSGVQLSVSSRSAGKVDQRGVVTLFKIFTFDLVAEPGFAQAIIQPSMAKQIQENFSMINESMSTSKNTSILDNVDKLEFLYESKFFGDNARIYKIKEDYVKSFEKNLNLQNTNNINEMGMLSKDEFNQYSKSMQNEISAIKKLILEFKGLPNQAQAQDDEAQVQAQDDVQVQVDSQVQVQVQPDIQVDAQVQTDVPDESPIGDPIMSDTPIDQTLQVPDNELPPIGADIPQLDSDVPTIENTVETVEKLINYINFIAKQLEVVMGHSNVVTEMLNRNISYSENIGQTLNEHITYTNLTNKLVNEAISYTQELANVINENGEITEKTIKYIDLVGSRLNETIDLSNVISDKTQKAIEFSNFNATVFNEHVDFTNSLANQMNSSSFTKGIVNGVSDRNLQDNVSTITEGLDINSKIDKVLTLINERSNTTVLEQQYPFLKLLSENNKQSFYSLDNDMKTEIVATLNAGVYLNESDVMTIVNGVLESKNSDLPKYVKLMPDKYKPVYESMNDHEKTEIHRKASSGFYRLNTPYQIKSFWDSQQLQTKMTILEENKNNQVLESAINENISQSTEGITRSQFADYQRGYSKDYIQTLTRHASQH